MTPMGNPTTGWRRWKASSRSVNAIQLALLLDRRPLRSVHRWRRGSPDASRFQGAGRAAGLGSVRHGALLSEVVAVGTVGRQTTGTGANWVLAMVITTTGLSGLALSIMIVAFPA